jgi:hypothetical protein
MTLHDTLEGFDRRDWDTHPDGRDSPADVGAMVTVYESARTGERVSPSP